MMHLLSFAFVVVGAWGNPVESTTEACTADPESEECSIRVELLQSKLEINKAQSSTGNQQGDKHQGSGVSTNARARARAPSSNHQEQKSQGSGVNTKAISQEEVQKAKVYRTKLDRFTGKRTKDGNKAKKNQNSRELPTCEGDASTWGTTYCFDEGNDCKTYNCAWYAAGMIDSDDHNRSCTDKFDGQAASEVCRECGACTATATNTACDGDEATWGISSWGTTTLDGGHCGYYAEDRTWSDIDYCYSDYSDGLFAYQVCSECLWCGGATTTTTTTTTTTPTTTTATTTTTPTTTTTSTITTTTEEFECFTGRRRCGCYERRRRGGTSGTDDDNVGCAGHTDRRRRDGLSKEPKDTTCDEAKANRRRVAEGTTAENCR